MKARTLSILTCGTILLIAFGVTLAAARNPVSGSGTADLDLEALEAVGSATLIIQGEELAASVVVTLDPPVPGDNGVLHATASHKFKFRGGHTITTADKGILEPTETPGLLTLNEHLTIVSGTRDFADASGELTVHGQVQFTSDTTALVSYEIGGVISR